MILVMLLAVPFLAGVLCLAAPSRSVAQAVTGAGLAASAALLVVIVQEVTGVSDHGRWLMDVRLPWIPSWSIFLHLAVDGLALWLIALTIVLALCANFIAYPKKRASSYFASLNWAVFGVVGLFLSADAFLFFVFWEVALIPIYWLLFTDGERLTTTHVVRFIVLTQISGLCLLVGILGLAYLNAQVTGQFTFAYDALTGAMLSPSSQYWLLLLFLLAFLIKLPAVPFHGWMPSLFGEGPASTILVAILVKTSIFGLLRFTWPIFPDASVELALPMMMLGVATLLYGAVLAFSQTDPKRILAYGTLSHAGLLLMGVFSQHHASFYGVMLVLTASALSTAALLIMFERRSSVNFAAVTGLWQTHPKLSVAVLTMVLAGMGFPLFGSFVGEWLILWSVFAESTTLAIVASLGIVIGAAYGLRLFQRLCLSATTAPSSSSITDLKPSEMGVLGMITVMIIGLGLAPSLVLDKTSQAFYPSTASKEEVSP